MIDRIQHTQTIAEPDTVNVWLIRLPDDGNYPAELTRDLSEEEAARAKRFVFDRDRARFMVSHAALRDILARYVGASPASLVFSTTERGKPYLTHYPELRFNLSHSGRWAAVAVAHGREVGVDIEQIRPERSTGGIAERFFAPAEVEELNAFPDHSRVAAFFACWSRKEAYIKARGEGLHIALDSFTVALGPDASLRQAEDREHWSMAALEAPAGYAAALCAEGSGYRVKQLQWP